MAANIIAFKPTGIRACASFDHRRSDSNQSKSAGSSNWWSPIFGWSNEPDYIEEEANRNKKEGDGIGPMTNKKPARNRFAPGCFTEEKAKQLRLMTQGTASFHDAMYHSAIASRLASDFKRRQADGDS